jgi:transcriptional regulator with XRE-family HTH domain
MWMLSRSTGALPLKALRSRRHRALCTMLAAARKAAGFSQNELALKLKTSQTVIARIEIGERRIDVIEFIDLARALKIDPREVVTQLMR